jgi:MoaA/NifB/PqqE/SkfB family radical SAM enzyme
MLRLVCNMVSTAVGKYTGLTGLLRPAILHITVTNRCDLRCGFCNVWKERPKRDIDPGVIRALTGSGYFRDFRIIEFGGGEPFLVDLPALAKEFIPAGIKMVLITTNGQATGRILEQVRDLLRIGDFSLILNVSLDGLEETHDRIRGMSGSFQRATATLRGLAELKKTEEKLRVGAKFTFLAENYREIDDVYRITRELDVEFTAKPAAVFGSLHNPEMEFPLTPEQIEEISAVLKRIEEDQARRTDFSRMTLFGRLYFFANAVFNRLQREYLRRNILEKSVEQVIPCFSSFFSVLVHVDGGVYCCPTLMRQVGSLPDQSFREIWRGEKMKAVRSFIRAGKCSCFSQCDQMPSLVARYPFRLGWAVVKSYFMGSGQ